MSKQVVFLTLCSIACLLPAATYYEPSDTFTASTVSDVGIASPKPEFIVAPEINFNDEGWISAAEKSSDGDAEKLIKILQKIRFYYDQHFFALDRPSYKKSIYFDPVRELAFNRYRLEQKIKNRRGSVAAVGIGMSDEQHRFIDWLDSQIGYLKEAEPHLGSSSLSVRRSVRQDRLERLKQEQLAELLAKMDQAQASDDDEGVKCYVAMIEALQNPTRSSGASASRASHRQRRPKTSAARPTEGTVEIVAPEATEKSIFNDRNKLDTVVGAGSAVTLVLLQLFIWEYVRQIKNTKKLLSRYEEVFDIKHKEAAEELLSLPATERALAFKEKSLSNAEITAVFHYMRLKNQKKNLRSRLKALYSLRLAGLLAGFVAGADYVTRNYLLNNE